MQYTDLIYFVADYALHIKCALHQYLLYGVAYLLMMECLPVSVSEKFMKGDHTIHLRAAL